MGGRATINVTLEGKAPWLQNYLLLKFSSTGETGETFRISKFVLIIQVRLNNFGVMHCQLHHAGLLLQWRVCFIKYYFLRSLFNAAVECMIYQTCFHKHRVSEQLRYTVLRANLPMKMFSERFKFIGISFRWWKYKCSFGKKNAALEK